MVNANALAPEVSLTYKQFVMGLQPCRQAGVDDLSVQLTHHVEERNAPVVTWVLLITILEDVDNIPSAPMPWYEFCAPQGLHEPSKHAQDG